jgi:hypothetical protein
MGCGEPVVVGTDCSPILFILFIRFIRFIRFILSMLFNLLSWIVRCNRC